MSEDPALTCLRRLVDRISRTETKNANLSIVGQNLSASGAQLDSGNVTSCNLPRCRVQLAV